MAESIPITPATMRSLQQIRRQALEMEAHPEADADTWPNRTVLRLIAEIDRLAYMWSKGGSDDLITSEQEHLIINGSHACAPEVCTGSWFPPPAEFWSLPS